ncbi:hypothetical protein ABRY23_14335 [Melioribacteraceae bacterium 4301-Me]|uniref:hypothetical protein n=1 Tax=Pyranulibacter aquaticus TaxID=3163344 RepID=UPI003594E192
MKFINKVIIISLLIGLAILLAIKRDNCSKYKETIKRLYNIEQKELKLEGEKIWNVSNVSANFFSNLSINNKENFTKVIFFALDSLICMKCYNYVINKLKELLNCNDVYLVIYTSEEFSKFIKQDFIIGKYSKKVFYSLYNESGTRKKKSINNDFVISLLDLYGNVVKAHIVMSNYLERTKLFFSYLEKNVSSNLNKSTIF